LFTVALQTTSVQTVCATAWGAGFNPIVCLSFAVILLSPVILPGLSMLMILLRFAERFLLHPPFVSHLLVAANLPLLLFVVLRSQQVAEHS
jgi:hypothetical protein